MVGFYAMVFHPEINVDYNTIGSSFRITYFFLFIRKVFSSGKALPFSLLLISLFFPLVFVVVIKSNVYGSWRQFLFLYP